MRKIISTAILASVLFVTACGGRTADPVMIMRPGDEGKDCKLLTYDIENIEFEIYKLLPETKDKTLKNVGYGVAGLYTFFIPWLLIDFTNSESKEYEALRARHNHLANIAKGKGCDITPRKYPSLEDVKKDYDIFKRLKKQDDGVSKQGLPKEEFKNQELDRTANQ